MAKTFIFLFDGTDVDAAINDKFSNIYEINELIAYHKLIKKENRSELHAQISFYLPGIGSDICVSENEEDDRTGIGAIRRSIRKVKQLLIGDGIENLILRAYINLVANFMLGDKIAILGFSRGAVAARIFTRLVSDFGILKSRYLNELDTVWKDFCEISQKKTMQIIFCL